MRDKEVAIFQARIISTAENKSTEFLQLLQDWAKDEPVVVVNYVQLRLVMECSVQLNEIGETECIPIDGGATDGTTTSPPIITNSTSPTNGNYTAAPATATPEPPIIIIIVVVVCGTVLLSIIIVSGCCCCCCCCVRRRKKENIRPNDVM